MQVEELLIDVLAHTTSSSTSTRLIFSSRQLCQDDEVDLVLILVADEYHAPIAIAATGAGKHVMVEKPMTLTREDARAVAEAARRNGVSSAVVRQPIAHWLRDVVCRSSFSSVTCAATLRPFCA